MSRRPRIGVLSDHNDGSNDRFGGPEAHHFLNSRYTWAVEAAGGIPWLLPTPQDDTLAATYLAELDGLMLTGCGRHLDPALYDQSPQVALTLMSRHKQGFELALIRQAMQNELPILAICGGMQSLNVVLGGSLIQNIDQQVSDPLPHMQTTSAVHAVHPVTLAEDSRLAAICGQSVLQTNSSHTQSVGRLGEGLRAVGHTDDQVIEAVEGVGSGYLIAVQWHPEYRYRGDPTQAALFASFVNASTTR